MKSHILSITDRRRHIITLLAAFALVVVIPASPAAADEPLVELVPFDFFYADNDSDLVLITGPAFEEGCLGEGFELRRRVSHLEEDGTYTSHMFANNVRIALYDGFASGDELIGAACGAIATGMEPPQPVAIGVGAWRYFAEDQTSLTPSSFEPPPPGSHVVNSAVGYVEYEDGSLARVHGIADWVVPEDGVLDPTDEDVTVYPIG